MSAWGIEPLLRLPTSGTSGCLGAWAILTRPEGLEKVIYFAAYMITWVDDEGRHEALPNLEKQLGVEKSRSSASGFRRGGSAAEAGSRSR